MINTKTECEKCGHKFHIPSAHIIHNLETNHQAKDAEIEGLIKSLIDKDKLSASRQKRIEAKDAEIERLKKATITAVNEISRENKTLQAENKQRKEDYVKALRAERSKVETLTSQLEVLTKCECFETLGYNPTEGYESCRGCKNAEKIKQMEVGE